MLQISMITPYELVVVHSKSNFIVASSNRACWQFTLLIVMCRIIRLCFSAGWFGIRKEFCPWVLDICPILQEYGNISYKVKESRNVSRSDQEGDGSASEADIRREAPAHKRAGGNTRSKRHGTAAGCEEQPKCVIPVVSIDMPD